MPEDILRMSEMRFVIQRRNPRTGEWQTKGMQIIGKNTAQALLNTKKHEKPDEKWRTVPKAVADAYKQGWCDHRDLIEGNVEK